MVMRSCDLSTSSYICIQQLSVVSRSQTLTRRALSLAAGTYAANDKALRDSLGLATRD